MRRRDEDSISPESAAEGLPLAEPGSSDPPPSIVGYLDAWSRGDAEAFDELIPLIYEELRQLARAQMKGERRDHTLRPTALVNEVYLRLVKAKRVSWDSRAHFFGSVAQLMRQILVDYARRRRAAKRGGEVTLLATEEALGVPPQQGVDVLDLESSLSSLARMDPRQARIVELRFYAGMTISEVAGLLGMGTATVEREWRVAKAWLLHELRRR